MSLVPALRWCEYHIHQRVRSGHSDTPVEVQAEAERVLSRHCSVVSTTLERARSRSTVQVRYSGQKRSNSALTTCSLQISVNLPPNHGGLGLVSFSRILFSLQGRYMRTLHMGHPISRAEMWKKQQRRQTAISSGTCPMVLTL